MTQSPAQWQAVLPTPIGGIGIAVARGEVSGIGFLGREFVPSAARDPFARRVERQLQDYFTDPGYRFDLPLSVTGTDFQRRVRRVLLDIPAGCTRTYGELAALLGSSPRAVGGACRANPLPLLVPCHRVVAVDGLGGFAGSRTGFNPSIKQWLLGHEAAAGRGACA